MNETVKQLRYLIKSSHGWLGAAGFSGSAYHLEDRDKWFGWDSSTRINYLDHILNMSRFFIRCRNLASHCISLLLKRVPDDFNNIYKYRPWVVESFVDISSFKGICYKASNWKHIGRTKGRGRNDRLFEKLEKSANSSKMKITVPAQTSKDSADDKEVVVKMQKREAVLVVSFEKVTIKAPESKLKRNWKDIELYAVYAREVNPPEGAKKISWKILTTLPLNSAQDALKIVRIYGKRWIIEELHRVLKSSCNVEKHRQLTSEKLSRIIAVDMVVAWRIMLLTLLARKKPETPCTDVFSESECEVLKIISN